MDYGLAWLITGFCLVIAELVTGTFYLLVLGIACFAGALVSYAGGALPVQAGVAALCALVGLAVVHRYRASITPERMPGLDIGQPATFESWINKASKHARVRYRDTLWDADIAGEAAGESGEVLYITRVNGNTLTVSKTRPA
jgi:membrane protein implicated in regulation of membrane protease activity